MTTFQELREIANDVEKATRKMVLKGYRDQVNAAIEAVEELFEILLETQRDSQSRSCGSYTSSAGKPPTHHVAMVVAEATHWRFAKAGLPGCDPSVLYFEYRLLHVEGADDQPQSSSGRVLRGKSWVSEFNPVFQSEMVQRLAGIMLKEEAPVKIKLAIGHMAFQLLDTSIATKPFSWNNLQALQVYKHFKPRWSSRWDGGSDQVHRLLDQLETRWRLQEPSHAYTRTLVVRIGQWGAKRSQDLAIKHQYIDGKWVPPSKCRPLRVVYARYQIALDNETAFRVSATSAEPASDNSSCSCTDLAKHLDIVTQTQPDEGFFGTKVNHENFPRGKFVRKSLQEKMHVDWQELRFSVAYRNASHADVTDIMSVSSANYSRTPLPRAETSLGSRRIISMSICW